jgi:cytochrome c6
MTARRFLTTLALALSLSVVLLACSDDDSDDAGGTTTEQTSDASGDDGGVTGPPIEQVDGAELFALNCAACHQADGAGIEGVYPALADSAFVSIEDPLPVAETVVHGRAGMPAWDFALTDTEIAAILTYLRTELNDADAVDPEVVAEARDREARNGDQRDADESDTEDEE